MGFDAELTRALNSDDHAARERLLGLVHEDLRRIARAELARHRRGETLNTQALVNEAYLKLFGQSGGGDYASRKHFFATAARAMRQIVIDYARARVAECRGAGAEHVSLDALEGLPLPIDAQAEQLVGIDAALSKLEALDPRLAEVVELRFFAGLEVEQVAELLGVSTPTVKRDTRTAKAFLARELGSGG
ncbi:MAG: sigma-70 family RNA polymerase sigma factor [Rhodanobacteraceae bacterium]|jgi:RNA polymerase sigma factor (TIGR02999 family)|nr:sigma-70 family RNA polymerase sigma factor [Rhodanobacteraceae bacterium]MBL0040396.1 sigma-70 family RNA polymerase sigma factor [Xanthomonadales bacterium]MBP6079433.1 sigma-70 family RNA polymerase sigma factor [Xanthomonadales bacterium]